MLERECPCKARAAMIDEDEDKVDGLMRRDRVRMDLNTLGDGESAGVAGMFGAARVSGLARPEGYLMAGDGLIQRRTVGVTRGVHSQAHVAGLVDDVGSLILWGFAAIGAYFVVKGKFRITAHTRR